MWGRAGKDMGGPAAVLRLNARLDAAPPAGVRAILVEGLGVALRAASEERPAQVKDLYALGRP